MKRSNTALRRDADNHARQEEPPQPQLKLVRPARSKPAATKKRKKKAAAGKKPTRRAPVFTRLEERAARGIRIRVEDAEPFGWFAHSEGGGEPYHLFLNPENRALQCTCADACFRGDEIGNQCKHSIAVLLHVARTYLRQEYDPQRQLRAA